MMGMKPDRLPQRLTRRSLAAVVALPLAAQNATPAEDDLGVSRERVKRNAEQLRKLEIPIAVEPSFVFRP